MTSGSIDCDASSMAAHGSPPVAGEIERDYGFTLQTAAATLHGRCSRCRAATASTEAVE